MPDHRPNELSIFDRIVCGVDGSPESLIGLRQAARLQAQEDSIHLVAAANLAKASRAGFAARHAAETLQAEAESALAEARTIVPSASSKFLNGDPAAVLLRELEAERATLIAVGSHERRRTPAMLLGAVAARMLRDAPCSVLIAREARSPESWPQSIAVGLDGSRESAAAFTAASLLTERFGGSVRALASTEDQLDLEAARAVAPELETESGRAVDVLVAASESADLIVIGSRGLSGLKALGSVSERVANQAHTPVLVVRATPA